MGEDEVVGIGGITTSGSTTNQAVLIIEVSRSPIVLFKRIENLGGFWFEPSSDFKPLPIGVLVGGGGKTKLASTSQAVSIIDMRHSPLFFRNTRGSWFESSSDFKAPCIGVLVGGGGSPRSASTVQSTSVDHGHRTHTRRRRTNPLRIRLYPPLIPKTRPPKRRRMPELDVVRNGCIVARHPDGPRRAARLLKHGMNVRRCHWSSFGQAFLHLDQGQREGWDDEVHEWAVDRRREDGTLHRGSSFVRNCYMAASRRTASRSASSSHFWAASWAMWVTFIARARRAHPRYISRCASSCESCIW